MKNKKIILTAVVAVLVLAAALGAAYALDLTVIDPLLSKENREAREQRRARALFPVSIGTYELKGGEAGTVDIMKRCNKIEDNPLLRETGRTGDACMTVIAGEYRETAGEAETASGTPRKGKLVRVNLARFTEAGDILYLLLEKTTTPDALDGYRVFRLAPFELGWSPASRYDMIMTQEGAFEVSSTTESVTHAGTATGDNEVRKHFMQRYPPVKAE